MGRDPKPRKAAKPKTGGTNGENRKKIQFGTARFARIELSDAEKEDYRALLDAGEFSVEVIQDWLDMGYKLSFSKDERGGGVVAVLTPIFQDVENAGLQLSGRAGHWANAVAVLEYKDRYVAGEDGWMACEVSRGGGYSDIG